MLPINYRSYFTLLWPDLLRSSPFATDLESRWSGVLSLSAKIKLCCVMLINNFRHTFQPNFSSNLWNQLSPYVEKCQQRLLRHCAFMATAMPLLLHSICWSQALSFPESLCSWEFHSFASVWIGVNSYISHTFHPSLHLCGAVKWKKFTFYYPILYDFIKVGENEKSFTQQPEDENVYIGTWQAEWAIEK